MILKLRKGLLYTLFISSLQYLYGQQDEQSSMYMFNPLHFNPAYAGSRGSVNATGIFRYQWAGFEGAPMTQFLSFSAPLAGKALGAGTHISNDRAGSLNRTSIFGDLAYSLKLDYRGTKRINFGMSAGVDAVNFNFSQLTTSPGGETDPYKINSSAMQFNSGAGVYYHTRRFYAGASVPRLLKTTWQTATFVKPHIFIASGYVHKLNSVTDLKVSTLVKVVQNAPITVDLNANVFFYKSFWIGGMYRYNESAGVNIAYQFKEQWMFGYAFDFLLNGLRKAGSIGSHEIMLTYDMNGRRSIYASPRYF